MLTLSRKKGESFFIGDDVEIIISDIGFEKVKVVINAPKEIKILRSELKMVKEINKEAAMEKADTEYLKNIFKGIKGQNV